MADTKISELPAAGTLAGTEELPVVQSSTTSKATVAQILAGAVAKTLVDAKGDLIAGTAADTAARLAVGSNAYQLQPDSAASTGLRWGPNLIRKRTGTAWHNNPLMNSSAGGAPPSFAFPTINRVYYTPWYQPGNSTISAVALNMTAGGTASNVLRIGIFADDGTLAPGTVLDQGTVAGDAIAVVTWTPSTPVAVSDLFWLAVGPQGSSTPGTVTGGYLDSGMGYGAMPSTVTTAFGTNYHRGGARHITSSTTLASNPAVTFEQEYRNAWFQVRFAT